MDRMFFTGWIGYVEVKEWGVQDVQDVFYRMDRMRKARMGEMDWGILGVPAWALPEPYETTRILFLCCVWRLRRRTQHKEILKLG
jgi:hypothetical protein